MVGRATRLSRYVTGLDKSYTATARFGAVSDTLDAEGNITPLDAPMPDEEALRAAANDFVGEILQTPPMASAIKMGGERLYDLHRRGVTVERESRPVKIHAFDLTGLDSAAQTATFKIRCGSGTYVRTLISDLATRLGTGAYLIALRRTSVGHLHTRNAVTPDHLTPDNLHSHIIHLREVVRHLPVLEVGEDKGREVCNGRKIGPCGLAGSFRVECGGELLAVYRGDGVEARAEVVLCGG
jgi:tRNA pseudouridine55 synthase